MCKNVLRTDPGLGVLDVVGHVCIPGIYYTYNVDFIKNISRTSAVSSTNFRSILIFASCVVGTCTILYQVRVSCYWEGSYFLSTIMVSVGIYTLGGEF